MNKPKAEELKKKNYIIMLIIGIILMLIVIISFILNPPFKSEQNKEDGYLTLHFNITHFISGTPKESIIKYQIGHSEALSLCRTFNTTYMNCKELFAGCGAVNCECWLL